MIHSKHPSPPEATAIETPFTPLTRGEATIVAQATAPGFAGVAILRLSGDDAWAIAQRLRSPQSAPGFVAKQALYTSLHHPEDSAFLDDVIILPFKAPHSFTGEDVVELHCHGGFIMPQRILEACLQAGARLATKGEFTRRAMLNGKLTLMQSEALLDVIHAEGEALVTASSQALHSNSLSQRLEGLKHGIIGIQADVVAAVDYPEEVDEPERTDLQQRLRQLNQQAEAYTQQSSRFRLMREGLKIAILGQPNAGKSSLFNHLLVQERSIVTDVAGTTRDTVSERLNIAGVSVMLVDTAGLRDTQDVVERLGVERSLEAARLADAIIYMVDAKHLVELRQNLDAVQLEEKDVRILKKLPQGVPTLKLFNKTDALTPAEQLKLTHALPGWLPVSVRNSQGITEVLQWLEARVLEGLGNETQRNAALYLNERQLACLHAMRSHLQQAVNTLQVDAMPLDMVTIPLTDALRELDALLGEDTTELVLDDVFSRFCVGK